MAQAICELLYIKIVLDDMNVQRDGSMKLYCDNNFAISIAHNPIQYDQIKYIEIDIHLSKKSWKMVWYTHLICLHITHYQMFSLKN